MEVAAKCEGRELELFLQGELDHHGAKGLLQRLDREIETALPLRLTLDFSAVTFMDSSGIGLVMGRYRLMQLAGGRLSVTGASERIQKIMRLAGLDRLHILEQAAADDGGQKEDSHEAHQ